MSQAAYDQNVVPALGRPFQLGMLYDCRSDNLVTGLLLWDKDTLTKEICKMPKESSKVRIITSDDLDSKKTNIDINASITLKLLNGLIDISGSAKFLYDTVDSKQASRVVLHYSSTSRVEQLMISKALKEEASKNDILKQKMATHVVVGIMYGADAIFAFDHKKTEDSSKVDVDGKLKATVKKIPSVTIEGSISGGLSKEEKEIADNLSCKFYGDIILNPLPTTYDEALDAYRKLTKTINKGIEDKNEVDTTVPVRAWLLPLSAIQSDAPYFAPETDDVALARAQQIAEEFELMEKEANELKKRIGDKFQFLNFIQDRVDVAIATIEIHKIRFSSKLSKLLQSGQMNDLDSLLNDTTAPPFDAEGIRSMFDSMEREANTLKELFSLVLNSDLAGSNKAAPTPAETNKDTGSRSVGKSGTNGAAKKSGSMPNAEIGPGKIKLAANPSDFNKALLSTQDHQRLLVLEIITVTTLPECTYLDWMIHDEKPSGINKQWYDKPDVIFKLRNIVLQFISLAHTCDDTYHFIVACRKPKSLPEDFNDDNRIKITMFVDGEEDDNAIANLLSIENELAPLDDLNDKQ